jgi:Mn-dependent DtxR family transcriptional regulator
MWNVFKETITKSAVKHIPQKRTKVKDSRPWINKEIRKNLRKLQRLYKQKKKTGDQNTKEKYNQLKHHTQKITRNQLKHHTQKITRQSYWKYIENIVTPKDEEPHSGMKKFWTYKKHKRKDNIGISSPMMDGKLFCDPASKSNIP